MKKFYFSAITLFLIHANVICQNKVVVRSYQQWMHLNLPNSELRNHTIKMEELLDLVNPSTTDTSVWPETQRHRFPLSDALESAAGLYWESITLKREKMIGKVFQEVSVYNGPLKEFDINFYIVPNLPIYMDKLYDWWMKASDKGKKISKAFQNKPPFDIQEKMKIYDQYFYWIECENTPLRKNMDTMNVVFYPCQKGESLIMHPNFGYAYPSIGFYGPSALDCNHACKPEIHPYEWIWWLNVNPELDDKNKKEWFAGIFRDCSGRFRDWSKKPRKGKIQIPFLFSLKSKTKILEFTHLVWDKFRPEFLSEIKDIPDKAFDGSKMECEYWYNEVDKITIKTNKTIENSGLRYWISEIKVDEEEQLIFGYFNVAVSVENEYTFKLTQKF